MFPILSFLFLYHENKSSGLSVLVIETDFQVRKTSDKILYSDFSRLLFPFYGFLIKTRHHRIDLYLVLLQTKTKRQEK